MKATTVIRSFLYFAAAALLSAGFTSCQAPQGESSTQAVTQIAPTAEMAKGPVYDPNALSCDPFGGDSQYVDLGLSAKLFYLPPGAPHYTSVKDYFDNGTQLPVDIFFAQVDVPTRRFENGFPSQAGPSFKTPDGETLVEYFALRYKAELRLGPNDLPGKYQLAILSDDGAIVHVARGDSQEWNEFLNNDGTHPSRLGCATETLRFDNSTRLPIQIDFYQGPRYHIANILLWRHIPESADEEADPSVLSDVSCGVTGNSVYFDYTQTPPTPQPAWIELLGRGWRVVAPENFLLPEQTPQNPCCEGCTIGA